MGLNRSDFDNRLRRIIRTHQRVSNGATYRIDSTGLIQARPRRYNPKFPLRGLILLIATTFLFKGFIFATLGPTTYNDRVASLQEGTIIEKAGAWIMQADTATLAVAEVMVRLGL